MSSVKETKKFNFTPVIVGAFILLRAFLITNGNYLGIENMYSFSFDFSSENIVLIILFALLAVFAALVIARLGKKFGSAASWLSVLLVAEPLFFAKQDNCIALLIMVVGLIFVLNALMDKPIIPNEITLIVFLLVSCILAENAAFVFVAPALMMYFIPDIENTFRSTKKLVMLIFSAISIGAGIVINDYLIENNSAFKSFIDVYSFADNIYFKHLDYENVLLFVFLIPTIVFGGLFFAGMLKNNDEKSPVAPYVVLGVTACAYIISIVGFVLGGSDNFYTANFIIPVAIISMLNSKNPAAEKALAKANETAEKYSLVLAAALVALCFLSMRLFYGDVHNIAGFILTI